MLRAEARSGRPWAQQVSLPRGRPPVMIVTPTGSWPSPWVSVGVDRIDVVGEERRLRFPQPEGLQAAAEPRAQPAEGLVGRIPGLARFRLRMVFASVAHSRRVGSQTANFCTPCRTGVCPHRRAQLADYPFKDSAAPTGPTGAVPNGVALPSNTLLQLAMASACEPGALGFPGARRCRPATEARLAPLHIRRGPDCSARTIIVLRPPGEVAGPRATGFSANH